MEARSTQLTKYSLLRARTKLIADAAAICLVILPVLCYRMSSLLLGTQQAFPGWSQLLSLIPGIIGVYLRRAFYRLILPECGQDVCISFGTVFSHPTARLGQRVYVGVGCMLGDATLHDDVLVGSHVSIINGRRQHGIERLDIPVREQAGIYPRVFIGQDTWIGDRAIVTADVGKHCVIGAGAVVTKPLPDYAIAVGNPARIHGFREQSPISQEVDTSRDVGAVTTTISNTKTSPA
jgi:acetyltransferase-like isoleucine patch superfamily enzyme